VSGRTSGGGALREPARGRRARAGFAPWIALSWILACAVVPGQASSPAEAPDDSPVSVRAAARPERVTVGDPFLLEIVLEAPAGARAHLEEGDLGSGSFTVLSREVEGPDETGDRATTVWRLRLAAYETGDLEIPPVRLLVQGPGTDTTVAVSGPPVAVEVASVLEGEADTTFRPIKPPLEVARTWRDFLWIPLLAAGIAAALVAGVWIRRVLRRRRGRPRPEPVPEPHEWAFAELRRLRGSDLLERGEVGLFYVRLTAVLRGYLERRYGFPALDMTTREILRQVRGLAWEEEDRAAAARVLEEADLVKFARLEPSVRRGEAALESVGELVRRTVPPPPAPGEIPLERTGT
jgi:hypothetical protein